MEYDMFKSMEENMLNPRLLNRPEIMKIGENASIVKSHYAYRLNNYYDITLNLDDKEVFIGRFLNVYDGLFEIDYSNGKILINVKDFNREEKKLVITKVLALYEMLDDTFYACTEEEAIKKFDSSISSKYLKNPENIIFRLDTEKRRRTKKIGSF